MKELKIHNDSANHPIDLHVDEKTHPLAAYILLAAVPAQPPASVALTYGNSELIGTLLIDFYARCIREHPEMAFALEQVARGIIGMAEAARGTPWMGDGRAGNA